MSKKAIYETAGIFFSILDNAKAEAEKQNITGKPKKSFVTEEEFLTMLEDGVIVDFELEGNSAQKQQETTENTEENQEVKEVPAPLDMNEVLKRLEALESENKRLKEEKPKLKLSFEEIQKAIEKRETLQNHIDELLHVREEFSHIVIDEEDGLGLPELNITGYSAQTRQRIAIDVTNPFAISSVVDELLLMISDKVSGMMKEIEEIEKQVA